MSRKYKKDARIDLSNTGRKTIVPKVRYYRKKPVVIEAVVWTGSNNDEIAVFTNGAGKFTREVEIYGIDYRLYIETLEGTMEANIGDYIIRGINGEFYPCKPDIFKITYEEVEPGYVVVETALFFSKESSKYATNNEDYNLDFVCIQLMYLKSLLKIRGFLFLNEVAASLGIGLTPKGQTHGWLQSNDDFTFEIDSTPSNVRIVLPNISEMYQDI